jgi:hypothetical protein
MFFKNLQKEKELIDRELELYRREKMLEIDKFAEDQMNARRKKMVEFEKECYKQLGEHEHTYHSTLESRGIETAKLEAKIESLQQVVDLRQEVIDADGNLYDELRDEIKRLNDIIHALISKQPTTTIQQMKQ